MLRNKFRISIPPPESVSMWKKNPEESEPAEDEELLRRSRVREIRQTRWTCPVFLKNVRRRGLMSPDKMTGESKSRTMSSE